MWINKEGFLDWRIFTKHIVFEICLGKFNFRLSLRKWGFSFVIPLFAFYIDLRGEFLCDKEITFYIYDWSLWWNLWTSTMEWSNKTPRWRYGSWNILDTFLGKAKYSREIIDQRIVQIPMPEDCYEANIKLCSDSWKRPLWFTKTIKRIDADITNGIPHSGKGENSWDCGEDGLWGMCCQANSIAEGVGRIVGTVLKNRVRYGGWEEWNYTKKQLSKAEKP